MGKRGFILMMIMMSLIFTQTQVIFAATGQQVDFSYFNNFTTEATKIVGIFFCLIVSIKAIKELLAGKMINVVIFAILTIVLGWFVFDPQGAIDFGRNMLGLK